MIRDLQDSSAFKSLNAGPREQERKRERERQIEEMRVEEASDNKRVFVPERIFKLKKIRRRDKKQKKANRRTSRTKRDT